MSGSGRPYLQIAVTILIIAIVWAVHARLISIGGINHIDEFFTFDRSTSFARQGDWLTVYSENEPTFRKPPLQYWMSGLMMEAGVGETVALRFPSMLFALGSLVATALLAFAFLPQSPWVMPAAVLLQASSRQFWVYASSAMLDSGTACFSTLALAGAVLGLRRPGWWYFTAAAIGLGSMQKGPVAFVLVAIFLFVLSKTSSRHGYSFAGLKTNRHFRNAMWVAIAAALAWTVLQGLLYGIQPFVKLFWDETILRFLPESKPSELRSLHTLGNLVIANEPFLRWPGIVALLWLPWGLRRPELLPLSAILVLFVLAMFLANGGVYARYSLVILPLLAAALAAVIFSLVRWVPVALALVAAVSAASGGPVKDASALRLVRSDKVAEQIEVLKRVGQLLQPDETLVYCDWDRAYRLYPGAISVYASNDRPFIQLWRPSTVERHVKDGSLHGPVRGVCSVSALDRLAGRLVGLETVETRSGYVIWTAQGVK